MGGDVGEVGGYQFCEWGDQGAGYYRRADAPPPDSREYSRIILQKASAAGATFITCPEFIDTLEGYRFENDGPEGCGYYHIAAAEEAENRLADFLSSV